LSKTAIRFCWIGDMCKHKLAKESASNNILEFLTDSFIPVEVKVKGAEAFVEKNL
jgi:hypothetical protein